jgi:hypothetical protein
MKCFALVVAAVALVACTGRDTETTRVTAPTPAQGAAAAARPSLDAAPPPVPSVIVPAGTLYLCVTEIGGQRSETPIEFAPKVAELCRKAPEMSPCQYERENCRRNGGRVFAGPGTEITRETEAEYDKRVTRVRLKSTD